VAYQHRLRGGSPARLVATTLLVATALLAGCTALASKAAVDVPAPVLDEPASQAQSETAILAGGCFWGVQGVFEHVIGVSQALSGYTGGGEATADYETVSTGTTGHAESVRITFDPRQISYGRVLQIFFSVVHDPTELDRQGPDAGNEYRSAIFPTTDEQARIAKSYIDQLEQAGVFNAPIVTRIEPDKRFYPAEAYHQDFLSRNSTDPYIVINDLPKIDNLRRTYPDTYRVDPVPAH